MKTEYLCVDVSYVRNSVDSQSERSKNNEIKVLEQQSLGDPADTSTLTVLDGTFNSNFSLNGTDNK
jgi:hypothetical protein